jgi:hypothetical protein
VASVIRQLVALLASVVAVQARLTLVRVKDLEAQFNCQEGDLSCVGE